MDKATRIELRQAAASTDLLVRLVGEICQEKGFREDWDMAARLEEIADIADNVDESFGWLYAVAGELRKIAVVLRTNIIGMKLALIASEIVGEGLETLRDVGADGVFRGEGNLLEELADGEIRIKDLVSMLGGGLGQMEVEKVEKNSERPYKHGRQA